jgi:TPR repeat protein
MRLTLIAFLLAGVVGCDSMPQEKAAQSQPEYKKIRLAGAPQSYMVEQYRELAEQGHAYAQCSLGDRYLNGAEVPEDHVEAYAWNSEV